MTAITSRSPKSKTIAAWLAFLFGSLGLHRLYLFGIKDIGFWLTPLPTAAGLVGLARFYNIGQDDLLAWILIPVFGICIAVACGTAIFYALMAPARWQAKYNPGHDLDDTHPSGLTNWLSVMVVVCALMIGAVALMSSLVMSFQAYFESQVEAARAISQ